jgi:hypothetical protein
MLASSRLFVAMNDSHTFIHRGDERCSTAEPIVSQQMFGAPHWISRILYRFLHIRFSSHPLPSWSKSIPARLDMSYNPFLFARQPDDVRIGAYT